MSYGIQEFCRRRNVGNVEFVAKAVIGMPAPFPDMVAKGLIEQVAMMCNGKGIVNEKHMISKMYQFSCIIVFG